MNAKQFAENFQEYLARIEEARVKKQLQSFA
jgi:hypothetical protein